jgi:transcriptional regulator with XRE-family HTH domain
MAHHDEDMAGDIRLPMPSQNVQLLYPDEETAAEAADVMGLDGTHPHDFEDSTWFMPGSDHESFVEAVSGMDAGMAGFAPVSVTARLNEYKAIGPVHFRGTRQGELDESAIPSDDFADHYFNDGENKSDSSFPLVDGEGYLRRGNLDAAWNLRGQGDLGMPRDSAERLMLNLGLVFGPPDSEANPLPQEAYDERDDVGTPYAAESAMASRLAGVTDDPKMGEDTASMSENAQLGSYLGRAMGGKMEEMAYRSEMGHAEMMKEMASHCGMSESYMRSIRRGDAGCPSMDAIEAMADVLDADVEMLIDAAERDGCDYSAASYHDDDDEEKMSQNPEDDRIAELEETVAELREENREVKREYAEALASGDSLLTTDELMDKFTVSELSDKYDDADAQLAPSEPTVRGGDAPTETADLSATERERVSELESELSEWQDRDSRLAKAETERLESELADLRGDD